MALGTNGFTGASGDLDVMIPEIWGERLNDYFKASLVMGSFFTDRSSELASGGDTLHTPNLTAMASSTKSNNAEVTLVSPTETKIDLVVQTWKEVSFLIEDKELASVKKSYSIQERYIQNAAHTIAQDVEDAIAALFAGFSQTVGASSTNLADSEIRQAIAYLEAANVPVYNGDVAFFVHPNTFWLQIQALDKFSLAVNSPVNDPTARRPDGHLYGIPVYISTRCPKIGGTTDGRTNALASKDAIHWASLSLPSTGKSYTGAMGVRLQTNYIPEYLGFLSTADIVYGVIENRDACGVWIKTHYTKA
jgi:phosphopantothenate synthetase